MSGSTGSGSGTTGSGMSGTTGSGSGTTGSGMSGSTGSGSGATGSGMSGSSDMSGMNGMTGMQALQDLQNASGEEFNRLWVSQMLTMHEAKLTELETASRTIRDAELTSIVSKALPKVRAHRDMLSKMNGGSRTGNRGSRP
jgi:hypothetical protein